MADPDNIPDTFLNKAQIAVKYSISRVTVDRYLKQLEKEGRLFPIKVQQGKRTLYSYDPNDLDESFKSLLQKNKRQTTVQKNVSVVANVQTQSQIELLRSNLQNAEKRILEKDEMISDLKEQRDKKDRQIEVLQSLITDQRPSSTSPAPEAPQPTPEAPKEEALPSVEPTELGPYQDPYQPDSSIIEEQKRIYFEKTGKDIPPLKTQKDYDEFRKIVGSDYEIMHGLEQRFFEEETTTVAGKVGKVKAKDAEPAPQSDQTKEESTQPSEQPLQGEVKFTPAEPAKKRGFFRWVKDNW